MRIAVLSDIHGNLEALEAVLADLQPRGVDRLVCLGDLVGYGPDPEAVVSRVRELGVISILGNHEAALAGGRELEQMNFQARENNIATKALLAADNLRYCQELPRAVTVEGALFVHGCPPDSVGIYLYLLSDEKLKARLLATSQHLSFVGHTHELKSVSLEGGQAVRRPLGEGRLELAGGLKYLINCGSVGQPREADRRAKYLIWDCEALCIEIRAVDYDVRRTAEKILQRGFPRSFADRLW